MSVLVEPPSPQAQYYAAQVARRDSQSRLRTATAQLTEDLDAVLAGCSRERAVLLVDDLESYRSGTVAYLAEALGVPVYAAASANEARVVMRSKRPAVIVTDLHLGVGESGAELLKTLDRGARAVVYSGYVEAEGVRSVAAAFNAAVTPKGDSARLCAIVRRLLDEAAPRKDDL